MSHATTELVERLRLAIASRPKFKALPIDIEDVRAIIAALESPSNDWELLDYVDVMIGEAKRDGLRRRLVFNHPTERTSVYLDVIGPATSFREIVKADWTRRATLDAHRAKAGR